MQNRFCLEDTFALKIIIHKSYFGFSRNFNYTIRLTFAKNGRPCFIMACWLFIVIYCLSCWNNAILHVTSRILLRWFCNLEIARHASILGNNFLHSGNYAKCSYAESRRGSVQRCCCHFLLNLRYRIEAFFRKSLDVTRFLPNRTVSMAESSLMAN